MQKEMNNLKQTKKLAEQLAPKIKKGDVITLKGDLGAGKTTFARFLINALASEKLEVTSPTFNIAHTYDLANFTLWHFDLYRLEEQSEAEEVGLYDALDQGVAIIEWAEIVSDMLPDDRLLINIIDNEGNRTCHLQGFGNWQERIGKL